MIPGTSLPTRPLDPSIIPLSWGEQGRVRRHFAPSSAWTSANLTARSDEAQTCDLASRVLTRGLMLLAEAG